MMREQTNDPIVVTTTFEDRHEAERLTDLLVKKRLIACGQISGPVTSTYWWNDEIVTTAEVVLSMKTTTDHYADLERTIRSNHTYQLPEIIALPVIRISDDYRDWLARELTR